MQSFFANVLSAALTIIISNPEFAYKGKALKIFKILVK